MKDIEIMIKVAVKVPDETSNEILTDMAETMASLAMDCVDAAYDYTYRYDDTPEVMDESDFEKAVFKIPSIHDDWQEIAPLDEDYD